MIQTQARRPRAKQVRVLQRAAHLVAGAAVAAYIYLTPPPGTPAQSAIRWFVVPALLISGLSLWQWPRVRRLLRHRTAQR